PGAVRARHASRSLEGVPARRDAPVQRRPLALRPRPPGGRPALGREDPPRVPFPPRDHPAPRQLLPQARSSAPAVDASGMMWPRSARIDLQSKGRSVKQDINPNDAYLEPGYRRAPYLSPAASGSILRSAAITLSHILFMRRQEIHMINRADRCSPQQGF